MLEAKLSDWPIVEAYERNRQVFESPAYVDGWKPSRQDRLRHPPIVDPRKNAVALPVLEPCWRSVVQSVWLEINGPRAVFLMVSSNAAQQSAAVLARRFD